MGHLMDEQPRATGPTPAQDHSTNTRVAETILAQVDSVRPDSLTPGKDVGATAITNGVEITTLATGRRVRIVYDADLDLYDVTVTDGEEHNTHEGCYCDQLGEIVWGEDAKPWTLPLGGIIDLDTGEELERW
jgi:hypothetical protein